MGTVIPNLAFCKERRILKQVAVKLINFLNVLSDLGLFFQCGPIYLYVQQLQMIVTDKTFMLGAGAVVQ